jgi:hypothetical protein
MNTTTRKASSSALEARIRGVNRANACANELAPKLAEVFEPLIGQKIEKVDGPLLLKVEKLVEPVLPSYSHELHVYRHTSPYQLAYTVKTCEPQDKGDYQVAHYHETTIYVGEMNNGVLVRLNPMPTTFRTDYTASGITAARDAYKQAKAKADEAHSMLYPFGEYDR